MQWLNHLFDQWQAIIISLLIFLSFLLGAGHILLRWLKEAKALWKKFSSHLH